jgi:hypothetical protein
MIIEMVLVKLTSEKISTELATTLRQTGLTDNRLLMKEPLMLD